MYEHMYSIIVHVPKSDNEPVCSKCAGPVCRLATAVNACSLMFVGEIYRQANPITLHIIWSL